MLLEVIQRDLITVPVLFCIDGNFLQHAGVSIAALLHRNPSSRFRIILISTTELDQDSLAHIRTVVQKAGNATLETMAFRETAKYAFLPVHSHLTFAAYLRLFMTEYLDRTIDKVLYLDSDVIVCSDISELWEIDLGESYLGAAPEPYDEKQRLPLGFGPEDLYINSGVMLVNLSKWRKDNVIPKFLAFAKSHRSLLPSADQDVLNSVFRGHILNIGYKWNWQALFVRFTHKELGLTPEEYADLRQSPRLVHYTSGYKPWYDRWQPHYKHLYYKALALTPWKGYVPPDRTPRYLHVKVRKLLQRRLEWSLPEFARHLRKLA
jgi:lipopolysaccharide biosynthesis glycosyltransferase